MTLEIRNVDGREEDGEEVNNCLMT